MLADLTSNQVFDEVEALGLPKSEAVASCAFGCGRPHDFPFHLKGAPLCLKEYAQGTAGYHFHGKLYHHPPGASRPHHPAEGHSPKLRGSANDRQGNRDARKMSLLVCSARPFYALFARR